MNRYQVRYTLYSLSLTFQVQVFNEKGTREHTRSVGSIYYTHRYLRNDPLDRSTTIDNGFIFPKYLHTTTTRVSPQLLLTRILLLRDGRNDPK